MLRRLTRCLHIGQTIPNLKLALVHCRRSEYEIDIEYPSSKIFANKKVVLVGFPAAYTRTCQYKHLPEYNQRLADFASKGFTVVGLAVNCPFTLKAFAEELKGTMSFISDANAALTTALEAGAHFNEACLGFRTRRFSLVVENGTITQVNDEHGGQMTDVSRAETVLRSI
jgi:peroxiredoxin